MTQHRAPDQTRLPQLDGLRAVAAVFVLLFHYNVVFGGLPLFRHAELAVDFFFLLSGYVLSAGIDRDCRSARAGLAFLARRVARLWPVMALGTAAGFLVAWFGQGTPQGLWSPLVLALLFIPSAKAREPIFPLDGPQWSLLLELIANAVHGLFLWRLRTPMLLLAAAISWLCLAWVAHIKDEIGFGPMYPGWQIGLLRIGFAYTLGCAIGRHSDQVARLVRAPWCLALLALGLLLTRPGSGGGLDGAGDMLTLLAFPLVLAFALQGRPPAFLHKPMRIAGAASWPLYAFHIPLLDAAKLVSTKGLVPQELAAPAAVLVAIGLAVAVGSSRLVKGFTLPSPRLGPAAVPAIA